INDEKVRSVIAESKNRIKSIALLHEKLYENKISEKIDIKEYTYELVNYIKQTFNYQDKIIEVVLNIDSIRLNMDVALPLSLIINELVTNTYKHAFKNQDHGIIKMSVLQKDDKMYFSYEDNGHGEQTKKRENISQFGLTLIETLANQLDPDHKMNNEGFNFEIAIKVT
ncbi:MAG: sensor histidine kinase, partial [Bacteroidia bacterium]